MLSSPHTHENGLRVVMPAPLPVAELVLGKPVDEVCALIPRLFNLCRAAQAVAVRMALGVPVKGAHDLHHEIKREHLLRLAVILPARLKVAPLGIPGRDDDVAAGLFGTERFAETPEAFEAFLASGTGIAPVFTAIRAAFGAGEAVSGILPRLVDDAVFDSVAMENSVASRHPDHPVLGHVAEHNGRGPLWRAVARAVDLQAVLDGDLPEPRMTTQGVAMVPAARGTYAVAAQVQGGKVTQFRRATPTDYMLAPDGIMQRSLASLPVAKHDQAGLLVDILDPCTPLEVRGMADA
ncbi:hydrogenase expression/formation protein HupK [Shimia sp. W99]